MLLANQEDKFINTLDDVNAMVSAELIAYIQSMLRNGYSEQQIRIYLLRSGYRATDLDQAFNQLQHDIAIAPATGSRPPWFWIAGAVLGLGIGGIIIALLFAAPAAQITLVASPLQVEVRAGDVLDIKDTFRSNAAGTLNVLHTLIDPSTREAIGAPSTETVTVSAGSKAETFQVQVPSTITPGRYIMDVTAIDSGGTQTKTSFSFNVLAAKATCSDGVQNQRETGVDCGGTCKACLQIETPGQPPSQPQQPTQPEQPPQQPTTEPKVADCPGGCNDYDVTTDDECVDGQCVHTPKESVCGNGICNGGETSSSCPQDCGAGLNAPSADEVIENAKTQAPQDTERATALCGALPRPQDKDRCFSVVASSSGKSDLCASIVEDITRDQCYIDFALTKNEFDVCEKIQNRYLRGSCNSLQNLRQLERQRQAEQAAQETQVPATEEQPVAEQTIEQPV